MVCDLRSSLDVAHESADDEIGSRKYMKLNSKIHEARWDEGEGVWRLKIVNPQTGEESEDWAHCFVNGTGM